MINNKYKMKLQTAIDNNTLFLSLKHAFIKRWPIRFIEDNDILEIQEEYRVMNKLKRQFKRRIHSGAESTSDMNIIPNPKIIWWCWLQGENNAPLIVKKCLSSIYKYYSDYDIRIISLDNIHEYIQLPEYIMKKYNAKIITNVHLTDILRVELLSKYGGIWIDATVLCTDDSMKDIFNYTDMFVYSNDNNPSIKASSWLIYAKPNHPIIKLTRDLLRQYWKKKKIIDHYYLIHILMTMSFEQHRDLYERIPKFSNIPPHYLVQVLNKKYDDSRFEQIKKMTSFHKLNHKLVYDTSENTFYHKLIMSGDIK